MDRDSIKFEVQTEGLGEFWGVAPDYRERRSRDPMSADHIKEIILTLLDENGKEAKGLFVVEHNKKPIHIRLDNGVIELSDPNNANYQNIAISADDLKASLYRFFNIRIADMEVQNSNAAFLEWIIAIISGAGMLAAFYFALQYLEKKNQFMPEPEYMEVSSQEDFRSHLREMAGVYVTKLEDGETLLNIQESGNWEFYDLEMESDDRFEVSLIEKGFCRPVYQKGKLTMLTDVNYLFHWESEGVLEFQGRRYVRTAKTESEVPFMTFPE